MTATALAAVAVLCVYYYLVDPSDGGTPRCMLRLLTGYDCPGCGSQRALHALLHGRIAQAWSFNPAIFFAVPLAALYAAIDHLPPFLARILRAPLFILSVAALIALWWIARNL